MKSSKMMGVLGLLGALAVSGYASTVVAQGQLTIGGNQANFGRRALRRGFVPDPTNVNVTSGGSLGVAGMNLGPGCAGFVTQRPDFILNYTAAAPGFLRFYVTAGGDTTLVINGADGQWHCNDDSNGGTNPTVDIAAARTGQYDVWVGSYQAGANVAGVLHITELSSNHP